MKALLSVFDKIGIEEFATGLHNLGWELLSSGGTAKQIAEARDKGDLSENAEYDAAKEAQGLLELEISKLEETVANARIIDESQLCLLYTSPSPRDS